MLEEDQIDYIGIREHLRQWAWEPIDDEDGPEWPEELGDSEC